MVRFHFVGIVLTKIDEIKTNDDYLFRYLFRNTYMTTLP